MYYSTILINILQIYNEKRKTLIAIFIFYIQNPTYVIIALDKNPTDINLQSHNVY